VRNLGEADARLLHAAVEKDRAHLDAWLRWTPTLRSPDDALTLLRGIAAAGGFHQGIWDGETLIGGVICWNIHAHHRSSEVGYWLAASATGRGLVTTAVAGVVDDLFRNREVNRIEMLTAEANLRSRAVCERLSFRLESVRRGSHRFPNGFNDHLVYARLAGDPVLANPPRRLLTENEFRGLLNDLADAWHKRDYRRAADAFAEDVHYGDPTRYSLQGRDALRGFFEDDDDRDQHVDWHHVVFDPARQVGAVEYTYEGTHRYHGTVMLKLERGLIARWREYQHVVDDKTWEEFAGGTHF